MICPYRKSIHVVDTTEEQENKTVHTYREDYVYETCVKSECGAWHDNRCDYRRE